MYSKNISKKKSLFKRKCTFVIIADGKIRSALTFNLLKQMFANTSIHQVYWFVFLTGLLRAAIHPVNQSTV